MKVVDGVASGSGGCAISQGGGAELMNGAGVRGVEERVGGLHVDSLGDSGHSEHDGNFLLQLRANLDQRIVGGKSRVLDGEMVSAERQFFGDVFASGRDVKGEFEVARLADEKSVRGHDGAIGVRDGEPEFSGAILCARQRDAEKEQKRGVDVGAAQIDSPKATGDVWRYFTGLVGDGCWTVALVPLGPESRVSPHGETI